MKNVRLPRILRLPRGLAAILVRDKGGQALIPARMVFASHLGAVIIRKDGRREERDLGSGTVTHAGVRRLSQDTAISSGAAAFNIFDNHGTGTGTTAPTVNDTALEAAIGSTATAGTNTNADDDPDAIVQSVATVAYSGTHAVTEWVLASQTTLAGATIWDRKTFAALNVESGDSIQFTYTLTIASGG